MRYGFAFTPEEVWYLYHSLNPETHDACIWKEDCIDCEEHLVLGYKQCKEFIKRIISLIKAVSSRTDTQLACGLTLLRSEQTRIQPG